MEDNRKHPRCPIHWRSAILVEGTGGAETIQCKTNDISANGVSVICHRNLATGYVLTVYLLIDPGSATHPQVIFEAQGKVMNNVLSGQQGGFRLGIQFTKFARDSKQLLLNHLPKEVVKPERLVVPESVTPAAPAAAADAGSAAAAPTVEPAVADADAASAAAEPAAPAADAAPAEAVAPAAGDAPADGATPSSS